MQPLVSTLRSPLSHGALRGAEALRGGFSQPGFPTPALAPGTRLPCSRAGGPGCQWPPAFQPGALPGTGAEHPTWPESIRMGISLSQEPRVDVTRHGHTDSSAPTSACPPCRDSLASWNGRWAMPRPGTGTAVRVGDPGSCQEHSWIPPSALRGFHPQNLRSKEQPGVFPGPFSPRNQEQ